MPETASSLQQLRQPGFQVRLRPTTDEKSLLPAGEATQQVDLGAFHAQDVSKDFNERLIRLSFIGRGRDGNLESAAYFTHDAISAGAGLSPNYQDAAFGMFRHLNHGISS
jgi:hypothetical protein